jgi:hypothetical protein
VIKRKRRKQTIEDVIYHWKKPYLSIINLTLHFQNNFKDEKNGLRLLHYRYALVKRPNIKSPNGLLGFEGMREFFGRKIDFLYAFKDIEKCITTTNNLCKYLKNLVDMGILHKIPNNKENLAIYRIDPDEYKKIDQVMKQSLFRKIIENHPDIFDHLFDEIGQSFVNELRKRGKTVEAESITLNLATFIRPDP